MKSLPYNFRAFEEKIRHMFCAFRNLSEHTSAELKINVFPALKISVKRTFGNFGSLGNFFNGSVVQPVFTYYFLTAARSFFQLSKADS